MSENSSPSTELRPADLKSDHRRSSKILWQIVTAAKMTPVARPEVPPDLAEMHTLVRLHACLRLFLLDIEFALGGQLRGIFKLACRTSLLSAFLCLCLAGVLACVSLVLTVVIIITHQVVMILWNLLLATLLVVGLLITSCLLVLLARQLSRIKGLKK